MSTTATVIGYLSVSSAATETGVDDGSNLPKQLRFSDVYMMKITTTIDSSSAMGGGDDCHHSGQPAVSNK